MSKQEIVKVFGDRRIRSVWDDFAEEDGNLQRLAHVHGVDNVAQHVEWMEEANLLRVQVRRNTIGKAEAFDVFQPTWQGLEFLAIARDQETWQKAMAACGESSFGILSTILHDAAMRKAKARM